VGAIGGLLGGPPEPQPHEVKLLQAAGRTASIAMENVQLYGSLEAKVTERNRPLAALNDGVGIFLLFVSHDLRAPLRHIDA